MAVHMLKRRLTVLGLGIALPFAAGVTPAHAQAQLTITKTHVGNFPRGGQGVYRVTVTNSGIEPTSALGSQMTDILPDGLTIVSSVVISTSPDDVMANCTAFPNLNRTDCFAASLAPGASYTAQITVDVAADAPCTVTNQASVIDLGTGIGDTVSDPTDIPGPDCDGGNGAGGSLVDLNGLIPMYNNITTNNNINSPGAANVSNQDFSVEAP
ncbi:hypothetical protein [Streptomyces sp. NPDC096132]|uniref:hypothetical protein n=1 Tax=Streptomyces sp. NPDC096132 TaxID=3366075 RepID=UPI00380CE0A8